MNPEKENESKNNSEDLFIRPLRTYEDDVKDAVQGQGVSTSKILMAEQQRRQKQETEVEQVEKAHKLNIVQIVLSFVFLLVGIGAVIFALYYFKPFSQNEIPTIVLAPNEFIDREEVAEVLTDNKTNREVIGAIRNEITKSKSLKPDTIKEIYLAKTIENQVDGKLFYEKQSLIGNDLFQILSSRISERLARSLDEKFMLGVHKKDASEEPFIIFKTNDYEPTFEGLLDWEEYLVSDVRDIFHQTLGSSQLFLNENQNNQPELQEISDLGTSTPSIDNSTTTGETPSISTEPTYNPRNFTDLVLSNQDTRAIINSNNEILFFYTIINKQYVILTTNVETLNLIIMRLNSAKLIR